MIWCHSGLLLINTHIPTLPPNLRCLALDMTSRFQNPIHHTCNRIPTLPPNLHFQLTLVPIMHIQYLGADNPYSCIVLIFRAIVHVPQAVDSPSLDTAVINRSTQHIQSPVAVVMSRCLILTNTNSTLLSNSIKLSQLLEPYASAPRCPKFAFNDLASVTLLGSYFDSPYPSGMSEVCVHK